MYYITLIIHNKISNQYNALNTELLTIESYRKVENYLECTIVKKYKKI